MNSVPWIPAAGAAFCAIHRPLDPPKGRDLDTRDDTDRDTGISPARVWRRAGTPLPYLAAYEAEVVSLPQLAKLLDAAALVQLRVRDGVAVSLSPSIGGTMLF
jgi:hypothetical protein